MNTTEEILARVGNVAHQMAESLNMQRTQQQQAEGDLVRPSPYLSAHLDAIDAHLAELRARFATVYAALKDADGWVEFLRVSGCNGGAVVSALARIRAARATESGEVTRG